MLKTFLIITLIAVAFGADSAFAQQTTIAFDSGGHLLYSNAAQTVPLSGGVTATIGDGAMLQLGYYSQGTIANPFAGSFITLAGMGGINTFPTYGNKITIGDDPNNGAGDGQYALSLNFVSGSATTGNNLPAAGQELAIRFFNNTTLANSTSFNAVTAPSWLFAAPTTPPSNVNLSLDDIGIHFQDGTTTDFYTSLPIAAAGVPEPSTDFLVVALVSLLGFLKLRRRVLS